MEAANSGAPVRINAVRVVLRERGEGRMEGIMSGEGEAGAGCRKNPLASWIWNPWKHVNFNLPVSRNGAVRGGREGEKPDFGRPVPGKT